MKLIPASVLAGFGLVVAAPAFAASLGSASIDYSLALSDSDAASVDVSDTVTDSDGDAGGAGIDTISAEGDPLSGSIFASADVNGIGYAEADASASSFFTIENTGDGAVSYAFDLTYAISAEAMSLSAGDDVFASAALSVFDDLGDTIFQRDLSFDTLVLGGDSLSGTETITLSLDPFGFDSAEIFAEVTTGATSDVAPIPLPATGWLLLAGLAGFAAARRRVG